MNFLNFISWFLVTYLLLAITILVVFSLNDKSKISMAASPCQCKVDGGCSITWTPEYGYFYADGTKPDDYDKWGYYHGPIQVPSICRMEYK